MLVNVYKKVFVFFLRYEKAPDLIVIQVYVKEVASHNLFIHFGQDSLDFRFRTSDATFLKLQSGGGGGGGGSSPRSESASISPSTLFRWAIRLKNGIQPSECKYKMCRSNVEIVLKKKEVGHWRALEASSIGGGGGGAAAAAALTQKNTIERKPSVGDKSSESARVDYDEPTVAPLTKNTPVTNSKPTYSNVSHLKSESSPIGDPDASSTSFGAASPFRSPSTTTVAASTIKPTCMVTVNLCLSVFVCLLLSARLFLSACLFLSARLFLFARLFVFSPLFSIL